MSPLIDRQPRELNYFPKTNGKKDPLQPKSRALIQRSTVRGLIFQGDARVRNYTVDKLPDNKFKVTGYRKNVKPGTDPKGPYANLENEMVDLVPIAKEADPVFPVENYSYAAVGTEKQAKGWIQKLEDKKYKREN